MQYDNVTILGHLRLHLFKLQYESSPLVLIYFKISYDKRKTKKQSNIPPGIALKVLDSETYILLVMRYIKDMVVFSDNS